LERKMSRIGRTPVAIPAGVQVGVADGAVQVKGPKGALSERLVRHVAVDVTGEQLVVTRSAEHKAGKSNHGLMRSLIQNMVTGVTKGFEKELTIVGVGYRAEVKGKKLVLQLGYSHPIEFSIPDGIAITVDKNVNLKVVGASKQAVGQAAAVIRGYRVPDHYKGKGVRYKNEHVRIKAGKSA
jgi:large subunit ribosomal protein L6